MKAYRVLQLLSLVFIFLLIQAPCEQIRKSVIDVQNSDANKDKSNLQSEKSQVKQQEIQLSPLMMTKFQPYIKIQETLYAVCRLTSNNSTVQGTVSFVQQGPNSPTKISLNLQGLKPNAHHGFHVHQFGDLTELCTSAGPHYNPFNQTHKGPENENRHVGDLGNIQSDQSGKASYTFTDPVISLYGKFSVLGRAIVVHEKKDDLGQKGDQQSLKTGNAGPRLACGVIGIAKQIKK